MARKISIEFMVSGTISQVIEVSDDVTLTDAEIIASLNGRRTNGMLLLTSSKEHDTFLNLTEDGNFEVVGEIIDTTLEGEYTDFTFTGNFVD